MRVLSMLLCAALTACAPASAPTCPAGCPAGSACLQGLCVVVATQDSGLLPCRPACDPGTVCTDLGMCVPNPRWDAGPEAGRDGGTVTEAGRDAQGADAVPDALDLWNDPRNCGDAGNVCGPAGRCSYGRCVCPGTDTAVCPVAGCIRITTNAACGVACRACTGAEQCTSNGLGWACVAP